MLNDSLSSAQYIMCKTGGYEMLQWFENWATISADVPHLALVRNERNDILGHDSVL